MTQDQHDTANDAAEGYVLTKGHHAGRALTVFELKVYARAGLTPEEAVEWAEADVEPFQAEGFIGAGASLAEAARWTALGVGGQRYATWIREGREPEEAFVELRAQRATAPSPSAPAPAPAPSGLVTTKEIAALVGSDPSVVTNWRKRHDDFPAPKTAGRSPLFDVNEVLGWLEQRGTRTRPGPKPRAWTGESTDPRWWWRKTVAAAFDTVDPPAARRLVAALVLLAAVERGLVARVAAPERPALARPTSSEKAVLREAAAVEAASPHLQGLLVAPLRTVALSDGQLRQLASHLRQALDADLSPAGLLDDALDELDAPRLRRRATTTGFVLAQVIITLAGVRTGERVLDPAMGEGELLLWSAGRKDRPAHVMGQEVDEDVAAIARTRFVLHGVDATVRVGDSLGGDRFAGERVDVVLLDPPLDAGSPQAWVRYAVTHLARTGRAVVAVPARTAVRAGLAEPFARGEIEAVVLVPGSTRGGTPEAIAVALLRADAKPGEPVLVVDLRRHRSSTDRQIKASWIDKARRNAFPLDHITRALQQHRRGDPPITGSPTWLVATDDVNDLLVPPTQPRHIEKKAHELLQLLDQRPDDPGAAALHQALETFLIGRLSDR